MKILQLGKFYPIRGGVEKVMWNLTAGLSAQGVHCDMLCAKFRSDPPENPVIVMNPHGRVICVPALTKKASTMIAPEMISYLRRHKDEYDLVHIHHPDPMAALALRTSGFKGKVVVHWHSDILSRHLLMEQYRPLQEWMLRRADRIVGTTPVYTASSPHLAAFQEKTVTIPIGIKPLHPDPEKVRAYRDLHPGKKIILSIGRLVPYKGYPFLVDAAALLPDEYLVIIGGTGPQHSSLEEQIRKRGIEGKVILPGYVTDEDLPTLFGACDVFALSSCMKTEAFGIVQLEAFSCGKPVVAPEIPESGVSWVNAHGRSGLNVPVGDPEALSEALQRVCADPQQYARFSAGAKERFQDVFTLEKMIQKTIQLYESLL